MMYMNGTMLLCLALIFCSIIQGGSVPCSNDNIAFYGGYLSVEWHRSEPNSSNFKKIAVDFMPAYNVGVLFFMEFRSASAMNSSKLVSMLSYNHTSLIFSIQSNEQPTLDENLIISSKVSLTSNNRLYMNIRDNVLRIKLKSARKWYNHHFHISIDVKNLLFGGAEDFSLYHQFPVRSYFVGRVTHFSMRQDCVSIMERNKLNSSQAVVQDNCTIPGPPFVEFNALSQPLVSVMVRPSTHLKVNFKMATKQCTGEILCLSGGSFKLGLSTSKFITTIVNSSDHSAVCTSDGLIDQSKWIDVMITYINDTVRYFINNKESGSCRLDLGTVNFTGTLMVSADKDTSVPFVGYVSYLHWDDSEINLMSLAKAKQESLCVGIGPANCNSAGFNATFAPSCSTCMLDDLPIHWGVFAISVQSNLTVTEGRQGTVTHNQFSLSYPGSQCLTDTSLHRLYKSINFNLQEPYPAHGTLEPTKFTFEDVYIDKVHYDHSGSEEKSDVIHLLAQVHCGLTRLFAKSVTLFIDVSPTNDIPRVEMRNIYMVIGTRLLITQEMFSISDEDTLLEDVLCTAAIVGQVDAPTGQFEWADKPGYRITDPFNQYDINAGRIFLRLFLNATGRSYIAVTVNDGNRNNHFRYEVNGISGKVMVMENKSVEMVENHNVSIDLVAYTNFAYQVTVTYVLTSFPKFGQLLRVLNQSALEKNPSHFSQSDIDNEKLFYSHTVPVENATEDCFTFQLMVDDFEGDKGTYCVIILPQDHLPKLVLNMTIPQNVTLLEGKEKLISHNDLIITSGLKPPSGEIEPLPNDVTILLLFMEVPKYGNLYLNNSNGTKIVVGNSNISLDQFMAGLLVYDHEIEEEHDDSFRIKLIAQNYSHLLIQSPPIISMEYVVSIDVTPINNKYPQIQIYSLVLTEGSHGHLTSDIINITDADRPVEDLTVYVSPKVAFNGHFASQKNTSVAISRFSVKEIIKGQIVFKHELGKELEEDYELVVSDGLHNSSSVFKVVANPIALHVNAAELCSLHLDLLVSDKVQIHRESFRINLDSGTLYDIQLTTTITSQIYFKNISDFLPVTTFSIRDIVQGHIWYVVKDNKTRVDRQHFGLNFSIGHSELVHVQFQVCLNLLPYPQLNASSSLALLLPEHGDIGINPAVLSSVNTVNQTFGVWYELTVPPTNGELVKLLEGPVFKFTQEDIVEGNIYYHNHNYSSDGDKFVLALSNQFYEHTANITIAIDIFLLRLKVVNNGFSVREGDKHTIVRNELYAKGPHGYSVMIYIETAPLHGNITLNSNKSEIVNKFSKEQLDNGLVVYTNDDEEHLNDSMIIRIEAVHSAETLAHIRDSVSKAKNTTYVGVVHITIELVNDNKPVEWNVTRENEVVVGSSITITSHILSFLDYDIDMNISLLRYSTIYGPSYGNFFFRHNNSIVHHFLQQNIYDLEVGYQNNKPDNPVPDICILDVSDGENVGQAFLRFMIVPFIVEPVNNESLLLDEGSQVVLSHKILLFEAARAEPPANDSEYIYKVTTDPIHGELTIVNSTFTQEELRNGFVIYRHDGSDTCKDNFTFQVTVRGHSSAEMIFFIDINEIDDEPPSVKYVDQLLVHFGSTAYFNNSILNAMDSDADVSDLVFNVLREPVFGRIKLERTGPRNKFSVISSFTQLQVTEQAIFYEHEKEIDGEWIDNVTLSLHDPINTYSKTIVITFILIPEELPIKVNGITLPEGQIRHLTTQNFEVTHPYLSTLELYINITRSVTYGHLLALHKLSATFFNSTELNNNSILYFNGEDYETTKDTFKFKATAGKISSKEHTFVFTIELSNDEIPMIIRNSIISVWAGEIKVISRDDLFANDSDADPPDKLKYIIHTNTPLGYFAYIDALHTLITEFYQDDIVDGTVVFKSNHSVNDTELEINFIVTDGKYKVESYITFEINVLTVTVSAQDIVVAMGADQLLSFSAQTNDNSVKREFYYQVLVPPLYGLILNAASDLEVNNFTQEQVNNHQIFYRHIALDQYETADVVNFSVFTDLADPVQTSLNISIQLKKSSTSYLAASNSLDVDEGGIVCLNLSTLDASNVLYEVWKSKNQPVALHDVTVQYIIVSHPSYGEMKIGNATVDKYFEHNDLITPNGVCYYHDGSETTSDHFSVKIKISYNSTDVWYSNNTEVLIPIDIRPINDEEPVLKRHTKRIYLFKINNYVTDIHPKDLCLSDEDTIDDNLIYTIVTHNQSMVMCSLSDTPTANFTQSDINNRSVKCKLPSDVSASNLTFYFTDGNFISKNYTVQYSKVDLTLSVVHNMTELSYSQEEGLTGVTLTTVTLNSSTTGYRGDTVYAVTSQPINGMIILNHSGMVSNFTQLDVDERMIQYRATSSTNYNDSFTVNVTNRHAVSQNITVHVEALAMIGNNYDVNLKLASVNDTQPLPADMFNITRLAMFVKNVLFTVTNEHLEYGHLELLELHSRKRSSEKFTFDGSQLREGRVLYVLDNKNITNGTEVLRLLVQPENMQAGIANVSFSISVQPSTTSPPSTTPTRSSRPTYNRGSGFTLFALVPIIGVPSFILMVVIILVGFWYSQKRKEKRRCAAAKGIPAICMGSPKFNLPAGHNTITSVDIDFTSERNSDHSSNNSDEGISMAMAPEDQMEDEQQYVEDHLQSRPVLDYTKYYHPLTSVHTSSGYNTPNPQLAHLKKLPVLKNEEYWL